ncbi:hypothetical protein Y88_0904 [Novosphingobium nitrogenifigens DSM 19370]|uniref:DUF3857 domain-containing protein n=2 Tax=Novosphingobium nitrogenifigens TaxID=378548 RepID=F1Z8Z6_9SPHN|nr:hypothetical protein Y88_0904 [Novosphingobium nitrogenifigens DSM 19370]
MMVTAFSPVAVRAADAPLMAPVPAWVVPSAYKDAAPPSGTADAPYRLLGLDEQIRFQRGEVDKFRHVAFRILTPEGLNVGNLSFAWSPDRSSLTVHKIVIHRGDRTIDVLASGQTFTVLRREQNLDLAMLDGVLTANIQPEGLQVGDVVEYAYTIATRDPVMNGHVEDVMSAWNGAPVARIHVRVSWPDDVPVHYREMGALPPFKPFHADGRQVVEWTIDDVDPGVVPAYAPVRYRFGRVAEFSDFAGWADLAHLMAPLYATASALPVSGSLHDELEKIRAASPDAHVRAEAALALVQDRVRYVALEMGVGGYVPADAATTWSRRFGDCKAKTALLLGLLHGLGIKAVPVIVNVAAGDGMDARLPMVGVFNHVLVRATIAGKVYWLDGTRSSRHRLVADDVPYFGWGLPLVDGNNALVRMVPPPSMVKLDDMSVRIDASAGVQASVPVEAELVLTGDVGASTNASIATLVGDNRQRAFEQLWKERLGATVEVKSTAAHYVQTDESLHLTMQGAIKMDWGKGGEYALQQASFGFADVDFSRHAGPDANIPYAVPYPAYGGFKETIQLPKGLGVFHIGTEMEVNETVAGLALYRHAALQGDTFTIEKTVRAVSPEFPAADAVAAQARLRALAVRNAVLHMPLSYRSTNADVASVNAAEPTTADQYVNRATVNLRRGASDLAIRDLDKAIALDSNNAFAWCDRALAQLDRHDQIAARADLARCEAIDPNAGLTFKTRGELARVSGDWAGTQRAYEQALLREPDEVFIHARLAEAALHLGNANEALRQINFVPADGPSRYSVLLFKAGALEKAGRNAELVEVLTEILRDRPNDALVLRGRAAAYYRMGKVQLALKDLAALPKTAGPAKAGQPPVMVMPPAPIKPAGNGQVP